MHYLTVLFVIMTLSVSAFAQTPAEPKYATEDAAKYADAAITLINEALHRLPLGLSQASDRLDTIFVIYPQEMNDPPQEFLDQLSCCQVDFLPCSQRTDDNYRGRYIAVSIIKKISDDSVRMSITADCSWIAYRRYSLNNDGEELNLVTPTQRAAMVLLVLKNGKWKIDEWMFIPLM